MKCLARWLAEWPTSGCIARRNADRSTCTPRNCAYLIPLPEKPFDTAEVVYRTVNAEGMVAYRQNFYSVPWRYLGQVLPLRVTEEELIVYGSDLEVIARHPRFLPRTIDRPAKRVARASSPRDSQRARKNPSLVKHSPIGTGGQHASWRAFLKTHRMGKDQAQPGAC